MTDPVTGPVPREVFKALADAPHGQALKEIRKYDPQYGTGGDNSLPLKKWIVFFTARHVRATGSLIIEAPTKDAARAAAPQKIDTEIDRLEWEIDDRSLDVADITIDDAYEDVSK